MSAPKPCETFQTGVQLEQLDALRHALTCQKAGCQMAARSVLDGIEYRITKARGEQVHSDPLPKEVGR